MQKIELFILSCSSYSDLWENQFKLLNKFFDFETRVTFLVTEKINSNFSSNYGVKPLVSKSDFILDKLKEIYNNLTSEFFLLSLDDYFLCDLVNTNEILNQISFLKKNNFDYLRLYNFPSTKRKLGFKRYIINFSESYSINFYPSIWSKKMLENIILNGTYESIWKFEANMNSSISKSELKGLYIEDQKIFPFIDGVRKGKYLQKSYNFLKKNGCNLGNRKKIPVLVELKIFIAHSIKIYAPKFLYKGIKSILKFFGYKFYSK
jgi:hypothetical protein